MTSSIVPRNEFPPDSAEVSGRRPDFVFNLSTFIFTGGRSCPNPNRSTQLKLQLLDAVSLPLADNHCLHIDRLDSWV
jgi:hypothetical protein